MTLSTLIILMMSFAAGLALGAFYFVALWQTVRRLSHTISPVRLMLGSFIVRMVVVMAGFYFIMGGSHWERLALAMPGFIVMRKILTYHLGPQEKAEAVN